MGLIARVLSTLGAVLLRAAVLMGSLFIVHLLVSRALPEVLEVSRAIERAPQVENRLGELEKNLATELENAARLKRTLSSLGEQKLSELEEELRSWELRLEELRQERDRLSARLDELRSERDEYCSSYNPVKRWLCSRLSQRFMELTERLTPLIERLNNDVEAARTAIGRTQADLRVMRDSNLTTEEKLRSLDVDQASDSSLHLHVAQRRIGETQRDVERLSQELREIRRLEASHAGWLLREWNAVKGRLLVIVVVVLLLPYVQRLLSYFVLMPLLARFAEPLRLSDERELGRLRAGAAQRSLSLQLSAGESIRVRSEYARPVQGRARGELLYRWRAPFISYAAGLRVLTRIDGAADLTDVTLAAPDDPNSYLMRVDLEEHPGLVIHPRHVVGVVGAPKLSTKWRLSSIHAWATWQLRYILFSGTGSVIVEGHGDVVATEPRSKATKIEQKLVMGFDARLDYTTGRTEVFWPYFFGKTPLVDDVFRGKGTFFWQKGVSAASRNPIQKTFDALFSALGKLLGF